MLHQFLLKLSISFLIFGQAFNAWPIQNIEKSILDNFTQSLRQNSELLAKIKTTPILTLVPEDAIIQLTPEQIKSINYFSTEAQNHIFYNEPCSLAYFLQNQNIVLKGQRIDKVEVFVESPESKQRALIESSIYAENYLSKNCTNFVQREQLFKPNSIRSTIQRITPDSPKNKRECISQWEMFRESNDLPFLCSRVDRILYSLTREEFLSKNQDADVQTRVLISNLRKEKELFRPSFTDLQFNYYINLCKNIDSSENFCANYISSDVWSLIQNAQEPKYKLDFKCMAILKKEKLKKEDRQRCIELFRNKPHICHFNGNLTKSSLTPMPSCKMLSKNLTSSKLDANFHDCPTRVSNPAVVNYTRIMNHFFKDKIDLSENNCVFPSFEAVYKSYIKSKEEAKWPIKLCYKDLSTKKEVCKPYVPGNNLNVSYSQNVVISDILYEAKLNETRPLCNIAGPEYNPVRLKYRTNCWAIPKNKSCSKYSCPLKVMLDGKDVLEVYTKGLLTFQYFQNEYNSSDTSLNSRLLNIYNLNSSSVSSVSSARFFLKNKEKGIIHGIGCLEDLYPTKFKMYSPTQCSPMPFIIDGLKKEGELYKFTLRTAIDDLHSPREISWPLIYSAVERYSHFHPLKKWNLYGIY